jgi:large subunit ribosomal protein L3
MSVLEGVKSVDVSGTSKGAGFAGVMKRHHFKGFRATHGTHEYFRHGGAIGARATPGKVHPGKRMPGQLGNERATHVNVAVVELRPDENLIFVRGSVPGADGSIVELMPSARSARRGRGLAQESQEKSKNPMKASKAKG